MNRANIVIDLGFGDGGKGLLVDNLCTPESIVIRFSGGQQAGHTVIADRIKHVFSSFGAGTLKGCPTFFTEDTTMYLPALINEYELLVSKGLKPELILHPLMMVTTPYDVAYNRAKESFFTKHGSCGMGVGTTMKRSIETPVKLYVSDFAYPELFTQKLNTVREHYRSMLKGTGDGRLGGRNALADLYDNYIQEITNEWNAAVFKINKSIPYFKIGIPLKGAYKHFVFEGSQGVMLDMDHGAFPNVTYANTTCKNAMKWVRYFQATFDMNYVTRCYTTRHGNGWMPNENNPQLVNTEEEINVYNDWQQHFRLGTFSYEMINHSIRTDRLYWDHSINPWDTETSLTITCLDQRPGFIPDFARIHGVKEFFTNDSPIRGNISKMLLRKIDLASHPTRPTSIIF